MIAVVDSQPEFPPGIQQPLQLLTTLRVAIAIIRPGEADVACAAAGDPRTRKVVFAAPILQNCEVIAGDGTVAVR